MLPFVFGNWTETYVYQRFKLLSNSLERKYDNDLPFCTSGQLTAAIPASLNGLSPGDRGLSGLAGGNFSV